jgi:ACS family allantoate permease-like MFS transporter
MSEIDKKSADEMAAIIGADLAAGFIATTEHYPPQTPREEKKMMRKLDFIMIPMVCLQFLEMELQLLSFMQLFLTATLGAVDKVALGTAALYGLREDNNLVGQQYSWLGSILSLGVCSQPLVFACYRC